VRTRGRSIKFLALTGRKVKAPVRDEWLGSPKLDTASFVPHFHFGFMCPVLRPELDTP
jgi:hypothetical protein